MSCLSAKLSSTQLFCRRRLEQPALQSHPNPFAKRRYIRVHTYAVWLTGFLLLAFGGNIGQAHKLSDGYLTLSVTNSRVTGRVDISLHDLEQAVGMDANSDGEITWGEMTARQTELTSYVRSRLTLEADGKPAPMHLGELQVTQRTDGGYAVLPLETDSMPAITSLKVRYGLMFEVDPLHLGLLKLDTPDGTLSGIFSARQPEQTFTLNALHSPANFRQFLAKGVEHIWTGYDHLLFLIALLLPAVLVHDGKRWKANTAFRPALFNVIKVVTAFTVAHSLTLSLAVLNIVSVPSRWVESTIAASVVLAAANNLKPFIRDRSWIVAFVFGVVHGFGFAGALSEMELPKSSLALALVGFNLGVEAGQLAVVAVFMPVAFFLRTSWVYRRVALQLGSAAISLIAALWCVERMFALKLMPF